MFKASECKIIIIFWKLKKLLLFKFFVECVFIWLIMANAYDEFSPISKKLFQYYSRFWCDEMMSVCLSSSELWVQ